jgi:hypothetical protein
MQLFRRRNNKQVEKSQGLVEKAGRRLKLCFGANVSTSCTLSQELEPIQLYHCNALHTEKPYVAPGLFHITIGVVRWGFSSKFIGWRTLCKSPG